MEFDARVDHYEELRRTFIVWVQEPLRSHFGNLVSKVVKQLDDVTFVSPPALLEHVETRLRTDTRPEYIARFTHFLDMIEAHPKDALGYMDWALWWYLLADDLKEEIREQRYAELAMEQQDPSDAQLRYLKKLGYVGPPPADMAQASRMINRYIAAKAGVL